MSQTEYLSFGLDPGATSGWAVAIGDAILCSGSTKSAHARVQAVTQARDVRTTRNLPMIVVAETWGAGGWQSHKTLLGLGKAYGQWVDHIELLLGVQEKDFVRVVPQKWRAHLFDYAEARKLKGDALKRMACQYTGLASFDEAEAGCLALYGQTAEECLYTADKAWKSWKLDTARSTS